MKFIKLTQNRDMTGQRAVYINPLLVTSIHHTTSYAQAARNNLTAICFIGEVSGHVGDDAFEGGCVHVSESRDEVVRLIEEGTQ